MHITCPWGISSNAYRVVYRTNTFPLVHAGFFHAFMNILALTPLLERFEAEYGTLTTLALFLGRTYLGRELYLQARVAEFWHKFQLFPQFRHCYTLLSKEAFCVWIQRFLGLGMLFNTRKGNTWTNRRKSIWVFTLIAMEAVKTYRTNPHFLLGTTQIPTWITPFVMVLFVSFLIPNTSFLGHICGLAFGYGCTNLPVWIIEVSKLIKVGGLGYLKFLAPPEWILRWIEGKLNLLGRLPHYVSVDQKTYGRYGVLPTVNPGALGASDNGIGLRGSSQRLGPWESGALCIVLTLYKD